jgi:hypothetical protein
MIVGLIESSINIAGAEDQIDYDYDDAEEDSGSADLVRMAVSSRGLDLSQQPFAGVRDQAAGIDDRLA